MELLNIYVIRWVVQTLYEYVSTIGCEFSHCLMRLVDVVGVGSAPSVATVKTHKMVKDTTVTKSMLICIKCSRRDILPMMLTLVPNFETFATFRPSTTGLDCTRFNALRQNK